jgi:LPS-assembly protein
MHLDYDRGSGNASHAALWFKDVPVFYTPAATFPLNGHRQSGFLHPLVAASTRTGFDLTLPYYWNIAPNYDATFFPRYMSKRGEQIGIEARYLDYNVPAPGGSYKLEYMPHDQQTDSARWAYAVMHTQNLGRGVTAAVNWNKVSDDFYWQDMSSRLSQTSQVQLPQNVTLGYAPLPGLQSNLVFQRFQTLQTDPASPVLPPYFMEPQMNVLGFKSDVLGMDLGLLGQYTRFTVTPQSRLINAVRPEGDRAFIYPQLSLPIVAPAYTLIPKIGVQATQYAMTPPVGESYNLTRTLPMFSVDSSLNFERDTELLGKGFIQTLEPRLYYVNIPYKNQNAYPVFDTYVNDFNFTQIFTENRFSGFDRLNDANQMTAAVSTRMLDAETGVERFKALIGQRYYFTAPRVLLPGETPIPQGWSNLLMGFNGLVLPKTYAQANWEYNYRDAVNERLSVGMRFQPEMTKALSASYRFARNPLNEKIPQTDQFDIAGQWPLTSRLYLVGRYSYSLLSAATQKPQLLEAIAGFEYNAGCWAFRAVGQRLEAISGAPNNAIFLQLELSDFASIGNNPVSLLRRSIPGYGKSNELPTSSALLMPQ